MPPMLPDHCSVSRRRFLTGTGLALLGSPLRAAAPISVRPRIVVVGGGWAGLTALSRLATASREIDLVLVEPQKTFLSQPLSNKWLIDRIGLSTLDHPYGPALNKLPVRWLSERAVALEPERRYLVTESNRLAYDWLIVANGISERISDWFNADQAAEAQVLTLYPGGLAGRQTLSTVKARLQAFAGGTLAMTIPPLPYRCPPAPYERACMVAWWLRQRNSAAKLVILDPNPPALGFDRIFRTHFRDYIHYLPQATIKGIDPFRRQIVTDFDTVDFDHAMLSAPQQAGEFIFNAGLTERHEPWGRRHPVHFHHPDDERIYLIGDVGGKASPLFGHYPKTAHLAIQQGEIAAENILAQLAGQAPPTRLGESRCYVHTQVDPPEVLRIDQQFRLRGDGVLMQSVQQRFDPQPDGVDEKWVESWLARHFPPG